MPSRPSCSLAIACLTYPILAYAKGGKVKASSGGSSSETCYDANNNVIDCPKKPWTVGKTIGVVVAVVVVVAIVAAVIFFKVRKQRAAKKYQALPDPATSQAQTPFIPPPQASFVPPPQTSYSPTPQPQYDPPQVQFIPPPQTSYTPPQGPPMRY